MTQAQNSRFVYVEWEDVNKEGIDAKGLADFLKAKTRATPGIRWGNRENRVLLIFGEQKDAQFLKAILTDDLFWKIKEIKNLTDECRVKVSNIPNKFRKMERVYNFFINKNMCGKSFKSDMTISRVHAELDWCVLCLGDMDEARKLIDEQTTLKNMENNRLKLEEFYESLNHPDTGSSIASAEPRSVVIDVNDIHKLEFIKQCYEAQFKACVECDTITWSSDGNPLKIELHFNSVNIVLDKKKFVEDVKNKACNEIRNIETIEKTIDKNLWDTVLENVIIPKTILVKCNKPKLTIIAKKECDDAKRTIAAIKNVKAPITKVSKTMTTLEDEKMAGFHKFQIQKETEEKFEIQVEIKNKNITLHGVDAKVKQAETWILETVNDLTIRTYKFPRPEYGRILSTPMMLDTISESANFPDTQGQYTITDSEAIIYIRGKHDPDMFYKHIAELITEEELSREGAISSNEHFKSHLKKAEDKYAPYVILSDEIEKGMIKVRIVCGASYLEFMEVEVERVLDETIIEKETISLPHHVFDYLNDSSMEKIQEDVKQISKTNCFQIDSANKTIVIEGCRDERQRLRALFKTKAGEVKSSWRPLEKDGITQYFTEKENVTYLENTQKTYRCKIALATKMEMRNNNISCMTLLSSGQVVLAAAGSLARPSMGVDAITNQTSVKLQHSSNVSTKLIKTAGDQVQMELYDFVNSNGPLNLSEVFVTGPGNIPCQRLIHIALFDSENNHRLFDETIIHTAMGNLFKILESDNLKSVAMTVPTKDLIKTFLDAVADNLQKYPEVQEVYFYDINPDVIRTIKSAMDEKFGGRCYHLPVENIGLGKGQMTLGKSKYILERTGKRTLPLPGGKRICIEWGVMSETKAEILVCPTITAPKPSGTIFHDLKVHSGIDLGAKCEQEFKNLKLGTIKNGTLVETISGQLGGCNNIYHLKISDKWPGFEEYKQYIQNCLKEALRKDVKTIALPTIGTTDCGYSEEEVATALIRTVGEFIKLHPSSCLEEVKVIVFKRDRNMTVVFEDVIKKIYTQRPHRLKAVIEETITGVEEPKEEEKKAGQNDNQRPKSAFRPPALTRSKTIYSGQNQITKPAGMSKYTISNNIILTVVSGDLTKAVGDVIVCTTSAFPKLNGQISNALKTAGGSTVQDSIDKKYPNGYPNQGVAEGSSGNLNCKKVYYIKMCDFTNDLQIIYDWTTMCLSQADKAGYKSIILPALGIGGFKFPDKGTADKMYMAIKDFFGRGPKSLISVVIVIYHALTHTVKTFQSTAGTIFNVQGQGGQSAQVVPTQTIIDRSSSVWTIPGTNTNVELKYGNIENWRADVIVDTTTSFPNLTGAIPNALCRVAGKQLRDECKAYKGHVNSGEFAITGGYSLSCKKVLHYVMPSWNQQNGEQIVQTCVDKCLGSLLQNNLSTIAMPTLGTGGLQYDARVVASALYKTIKAFGISHKDDHIRITVVMFPQSEQVNCVFKDKLQDFINQQPAKNRPVSAAPKKTVQFAEKADDFTPARKKGDFILLRFTSNSKERIQDAFADVEKKVKTDSREIQPIDLDGRDKEILADESKKKELKKFEDVYSVKIDIDIEKMKIIFHGMGECRMRCRQKVMEALQEIKKQKNQAFIGQHVFKYLEWCYTEDNGNMLVPYQSHVTFLLEENQKGHASEMEFKDSDENTYVVNFNKMEEYRKGPDGKKMPDTLVRVERRDLMAEDLKPPSIWDDMDGNLKLVKLQSTDAEYKSVESEFNRTLGRSSKIKDIQRIQNMHLYQLYETKKKQLQSKQQGGGGVERFLWHGVNEDIEHSIILNGFNRSYSGQTHGGQVWYGHGCYFAVQSEYASRDHYSPIGNGFKRVFQVGVLTGNTTRLDRGYDKRYAPNLPGSQTDKYDSVCDDMNNPEEFVIFNDTQAYPKYIIHFTVK